MSFNQNSEPELVHHTKNKDEKGNIPSNMVFIAASSPSQANSNNIIINDNQAAAHGHNHDTLSLVLLSLIILFAGLGTALHIASTVQYDPNKDPFTPGPHLLVSLPYILGLGCFLVLAGVSIIDGYRAANSEPNREIAENMAARRRRSPAPEPDDMVLRRRGHRDDDELDRETAGDMAVRSRRSRGPSPEGFRGGSSPRP
ncbi:hypothetical protein B0T20DRAFT_391534 [Sordaria brevicollis]|uniref:Uncharacterized protein n=1 Tax=Sordaria brevicollis TaxID=83679 RepID=A0AAE0PHL0_SORBR|nr:hypothetical protein B0T20DRAFT_391534 [Sordaria brevicollis]